MYRSKNCSTYFASNHALKQSIEPFEYSLLFTHWIRFGASVIDTHLFALACLDLLSYIVRSSGKLVVRRKTWKLAAHWNLKHNSGLFQTDNVQLNLKITLLTSLPTQLRQQCQEKTSHDLHFWKFFLMPYCFEMQVNRTALKEINSSMG